MDFDLNQVIRKVPNFPKKGILFYDITSVLSNPAAMSAILDEMIKIYQSRDITHIIGIESRGFLFASPLAIELDIPLILARKQGKLPNKTLKQSYELEYGNETLEIQEVDIVEDMNVLIIDDLIATGGTIRATVSLLEKYGANVESIFSVIGLPFLHYEEALNNYEVKTLINYSTETIEGIA